MEPTQQNKPSAKLLMLNDRDLACQVPGQTTTAELYLEIYYLTLERREAVAAGLS